MVLVSSGEEFTPREVVLYMRALGEQRIVFVSEAPACFPTSEPHQPQPPCTPTPQRIEVIFNVIPQPPPQPSPTPITPFPTDAAEILIYGEEQVQMYVGQTIGFTHMKLSASEQFRVSFDPNLFEIVAYPDPEVFDQAPQNTTFPIVLQAIAPGATTIEVYVQKCRKQDCGLPIYRHIKLEIYTPGTPFATPWWWEGVP